MPSWDELFKEKENILDFPQTEVLKFVKRLESTFVKRPYNTIGNIKATVEMICRSLSDGWLFMASLLSTKSGHHNKGTHIEPNTFIQDQGLESGVPHHYFDEEGIMTLFQEWKICILAEIVVNYVKTENEFYKNNPFPYTKWNILAMKES